MKSLEILKSVAADTRKPFFLAGDFNSDADSGFIKDLKSTFQILSNPKRPLIRLPNRRRRSTT